MVCVIISKQNHELLLSLKYRLFLKNNKKQGEKKAVKNDDVIGAGLKLLKEKGV